MSAQGPLSEPTQQGLDTARPLGEAPPVAPAERGKDLSAVSHANPQQGESGTASEPTNKASIGKGKLVVALILAALGIGALGYFLLPWRTTTPTPPEQSAGRPTARPSVTKSDESPARPSQEANSPAASSTEPNRNTAETPIRSAPALLPAPWPDPPPATRPPALAERPPAARPAETSQPAAPRTEVPVQSPIPAARNPEFLFLQRPGVNIRSAPSPTGRVVGSAPKGTRFEVTNRQGEWIEVNGGRVKGWVSERFLGPHAP